MSEKRAVALRKLSAMELRDIEQHAAALEAGLRRTGTAYEFQERTLLTTALRTVVEDMVTNREFLEYEQSGVVDGEQGKRPAKRVKP